ncbi:MAG: 2-dehydro-3-deoxy-6-phosphogalactonate aldolase [Sphingobium sp.]
MTIDDALDAGAPPIMAILRGIRPHEAATVARALVDAGVRLIEVPFNSPDPDASIAAMVGAVGDAAAIGGGTILTRAMVDRLGRAGGRFMVSPNSDAAVIAHAVDSGIEPVPGFLTPTEAFAAISAGARRLKLFPGSAFAPSYIAALRDVLPADVGLWVVGGVGAANLDVWRAAGVAGIGVGGSLYRPGDDAATVATRAAELVAAWAAWQ